MSAPRVTPRASVTGRGTRKASSSEHVEQALFFQRVDLDPRTKDLPIYAVPNFPGHVGNKVARIVAGKRAKAEGRRKGVPDICVDVAGGRNPTPRNGQRMYFGLRIEMKKRGGYLTPEQGVWHDKLEAHGYCVEVCRSADEAWDVLMDYLGLVALERAKRAMETR